MRFQLTAMVDMLPVGPQLQCVACMTSQEFFLGGPPDVTGLGAPPAVRLEKSLDPQVQNPEEVCRSRGSSIGGQRVFLLRSPDPAQSPAVLQEEQEVGTRKAVAWE